METESFWVAQQDGPFPYIGDEAQKAGVTGDSNNGEDAPAPAIDCACEIDRFLETSVFLNPEQEASLRIALDNLLRGPETSRIEVLKIFIEIGIRVEPLLVLLATKAPVYTLDIVLEGLYQIKSMRLKDCLSELMECNDTAKRITALRMATRFRGEQAHTMFIRGTADADPMIRSSAVYYLSWYENEWSVEEIQKHCFDPDETVRWSAWKALFNASPSRAMDLIKSHYNHFNSIYRTRLLAYLNMNRAVPRNRSYFWKYF
ncbi:MAG: HEAT repeat domain-containing protein [Deltaproteobacteria bacterium]|nr:HEAT repeat domain-containing protein [Deltaproteobacteria bacterium]